MVVFLSRMNYNDEYVRIKERGVKMVIKNFKELEEIVGASKKHTVAVAAAHGDNTLEAVLKAKEAGFLDYVLVGDAKKIIAIGKSLGKTICTDDIIDTADDTESAAKAVELIRNGQADFLQKGVLQTATILKAVVNKETGIGKGGIMSHAAIIEIPKYHKLLGVTDGGMIIDADLKHKKAMIENIVELYHKLGYENPKVAAVCAIEHVNPKMYETIEAMQLKEMNETGEINGCIVEGPISLDLAVSKEYAREKGYKSPIAGDADIIITPNIAAGNVAIKGLLILGNAKMAGCVLGAKVPIALTSRGAKAIERYYSLLLCSGMVQ